MYKKTILILLILISFIACSKNKSLSPKNSVNSFSFIKASVIEKFSNNIILELDDKKIVHGNTYDAKLADKIIKNSMFLIGQNTYLGNNKVKVTDIRGNQITLSGAQELKVSEKTKIYIPKKTIAIADFSIIGYEGKSLNNEIISNLTSKFVQSGQYIVLERQKLDTILKEHRLIDSGLIKASDASKIGKLISADIILTGSFTKKANYWKANLRLVDVTSGVILHSIEDTIKADNLGFKQYKESKNITENFENKTLSKGWSITLQKTHKAKAKASIDSHGANNTQYSVKIEALLKTRKDKVFFANLLNRDISNFKGIEFYAKSLNSDISLVIAIKDKNFSNIYRNTWVTIKNISPKWKKYKINFNDLILSRNYGNKNPGGDGILDLDNIVIISIGVNAKHNEVNKKLFYFLDEITLY